MVNFHSPHSVILLLFCAHSLRLAMTAAAASTYPTLPSNIQFAYVRAATTTTNCPYGVCNTPLVESVSIVQFRVKQWKNNTKKKNIMEMS